MRAARTRRLNRLWMCAVCVILGEGAARAADAPIYVVARIGSKIADDEVIGARRAGLMCLPAGKLRWRDIAASGGMDQRADVQDVLEDAGLAVTPLGETAGATWRIRGAVTGIDLQLCARHWALGDSRALSGTARLDIEWRFEGRGGIAPRTHTARIERAIAARDAKPAAAIYASLLKDAAGELATWLKKSSASEAF